MSEKRYEKRDTIIDPFPIFDTVEEKGYNCTDTLDLLIKLLNSLYEENEQLRKEKQQYKTIAEQYRKTVQHQAELLAEASKQGYCPKVINPVNGEEL